jgi:hypothetical protein
MVISWDLNDDSIGLNETQWDFMGLNETQWELSGSFIGFDGDSLGDEK